MSLVEDEVELLQETSPKTVHAASEGKYSDYEMESFEFVGNDR